MLAASPPFHSHAPPSLHKSSTSILHKTQKVTLSLLSQTSLRTFFLSLLLLCHCLFRSENRTCGNVPSSAFYITPLRNPFAEPSLIACVCGTRPACHRCGFC